MDKKLRDFSILICGVSVSLSMYLFVFSMPSIGMGVWSQSELLIVALHGISAFCAVGLILLLYTNPRWHSIFYHTYVFLPLAIGALSLALTPFHDFPLKNLLGSVRLGEGAAWWFDWGILSAACVILCRLKVWRKFLTVNAVLGFAMTFLLCLSHTEFGSPYTPFYFADFLAFHLIAMVPVFCLLFKNPQRLSFSQICFVVIFIVLMALTKNNIGIAYSVLGLGFFIMVWYFMPLADKARKSLSYWAVGAVPLISLVLLFVLAYLGFEDGYYSVFGQSWARTLVSRGYLIDTVTAPVLSSPAHILTGDGWGTFVEQLTQNLPIEWLDFMREDGAQWDGLFTDHFHSHNGFIELFYSAGILAVALFYIYVVSLAIRSSKARKFPALVFAGGMATLVSFWFLLPLCVPFVALAAGIVARRYDPVIKLPAKMARVVALGVLCVVLASQGFAVITTFQIAKAGDRYRPEPLNIQRPQDFRNCRLEVDDKGLGGLHLSKMLIGRTRYIVRLSREIEEENLGADEIEQAEAEITEELKLLNNLFCQSSHYTQRYKPGIRLQIARLIVRGEVLLGSSSYIDAQTKDFYAQGWHLEMQEWVKLYQKRSDIAVPFLSWSLINGDEQALREVAQQINNQTPNDSVGLWFRGITMLGVPSQAPQGVRAMRMALENGIERYMPVEEGLKRQLQGAPQ